MSYVPQPTTLWYITRPVLGLGTLNLWDPSPVDAFGTQHMVPKASADLGSVQWRQTLVKSPYVAGAVEVHAVQDIVKSKFQVIITAPSASYPSLLTTRDAVIAAFTQSAYVLGWSSSDGGAMSWNCLRANYQMAFDEGFAYNNICTLSFDFLRQPIAIAGAY